MSAPLVLLLDRRDARLISPSSETATAAQSWNPDATADEIASVFASLKRAGAPNAGSASVVVVVVGLGLLEIAMPELPPLSRAQRRELLARDADRYFPLDEALAVTCASAVAFAVPERLLGAWTQAAATIGRVAAVTTLPECLLRAEASGSWTVDAASDERGIVTVERDGVVDARRVRASGDARHADARYPHPTASLARVAQGALRFVDAPLDDMLLDQRTRTHLTGRRRMRWLGAVALLLLALTALGWSLERWRGRTLDATAARLAMLESQLAPAREAQARFRQVRAELDAASAPSASAATVVARLGALLPRDAFIERLEWDGTVWRIDGSANAAAAIVPSLAADAMFADVRIVAATTRFIDAGRQRETFSVSFRIGLAGAPNAAP